MIVTPDFVFIHFHKSGGQFVNRLLLQHIPHAHRAGYHLPRSETPAEAANLPAFGFVRNPWDWYVSWYAFNELNPLRNPIFRTISQEGTLGFEAVIENLLRLGQPDRKSMRDAIANLLPVTREGNLGSGITSALMSNMHEPERGYLTWLWRYMFFVNENTEQVCFGKFENLRPDVSMFLEKFDTPISASLAESIQAAPAVNVTVHGHYRDYYSSKLRELVAEKDEEYIQVFDYKF